MTGKQAFLKGEVDPVVLEVARWLRQARHAVAFTGAGISAESGLATFRDPGGLWDALSPEEGGTVPGLVQLFTRRPERARLFLAPLLESFQQARPNPAHAGLAELDRRGLLRSIITQNIDALHQEAGSQRVLELHGNLYRHRCMLCGTRKPMAKQEVFSYFAWILERLDRGPGSISLVGIFPKCGCGGALRPDVVLFEEPVQQMEEAEREASRADLMLVIGTTGAVYPAAMLPELTHSAGGRVVVVNPTEDAYSQLSDAFLKQPAGRALPAILSALKALVGSR